MPAAHGLVVGLKYVDAVKYGGWDGRSGCTGCELDVDNMSSMLWSQQIRPYQLKTQLATSGNVKLCLTQYANNLQPGDLLVFYYSGHGGTKVDVSNDETDRQDETLVLYNRQLLDDELNEIWLTFKAGVNIVMISDSCHAETNFRLALTRDIQTRIAPPMLAMSREVRAEMKATMIHMGGCRDSGTSSGWSQGGEFTLKLLKAWSNRRDGDSYRTLFQAAASAVTTNQTPTFTLYGPGAAALADSPAFTGNWRSAALDEEEIAPTTEHDDDLTEHADGDSRVRFKLEIRGANVKKLDEKLKQEAAGLLSKALKAAQTNFGSGKAASSGKFGPGTHAVATAEVKLESE